MLILRRPDGLSSGVFRAPLLLLLALSLTLLTHACPAEAASAGDETFARIGPELRALYEAYRAAKARGAPLPVPDPAMQVVEDRVIVDAVASGSVEELKAKLVALGMQGAVTAGRIVSGQLPIAQIVAMAALPELRFARAAMAIMH